MCVDRVMKLRFALQSAGRVCKIICPKMESSSALVPSFHEASLFRCHPNGGLAFGVSEQLPGVLDVMREDFPTYLRPGSEHLKSECNL